MYILPGGWLLMYIQANEDNMTIGQQSPFLTSNESLQRWEIRGGAPQCSANGQQGDDFENCDG